MGEGEEEQIPLSEDEEEVEDEKEVKNGEGLSSDEEENRGEKRKRGKDEGRRKRSKVDAESAKKKGVCYLSRIARHMDHVKLRQILSQYGEVERIYLVPENPAAQMSRKRAGGYRGTEFSEGWVEFTKKRIAKKVAKLLNGEQMGGKRRSTFYYDLWNIKYLRKFKWDDLTEEIAYKNATREQKLALELSAAKRERDFYLSKVDQSRALSSMQERVKKKQKAEAKEANGSDTDNNEIKPKIIRRFPQNRPIVSISTRREKPRLSKDILAGVFGRSST